MHIPRITCWLSLHVSTRLEVLILVPVCPALCIVGSSTRLANSTQIKCAAKIIILFWLQCLKATFWGLLGLIQLNLIFWELKFFELTGRLLIYWWVWSSSLNCNIWHSFCLFFYSRLYSNVYSFLVTSSTVEARKQRENWLFALLLMHFVSNTLCSRLQHTHFSRQLFYSDFTHRRIDS